MKQTQTDNAHLGEKLELRRRILRHLDGGLRVLDLFSGEGRIWAELGKEFDIASYTPCDVKPRQPGAIRITVDGRTIQAFNPRDFDVIDIDSYGDPFAIWNSLCAKIAKLDPPQSQWSKGLAVFLTFGHVQTISTKISAHLRGVCGIPEAWPIPTSLELATFLGRHFLERSLAELGARHALAIEHKRVSYYGCII